jgi:hypothetical protein
MPATGPIDVNSTATGNELPVQHALGTAVQKSGGDCCCCMRKDPAHNLPTWLFRSLPDPCTINTGYGSKLVGKLTALLCRQGHSCLSKAICCSSVLQHNPMASRARHSTWQRHNMRCCKAADWFPSSRACAGDSQPLPRYPANTHHVFQQCQARGDEVLRHFGHAVFEAWPCCGCGSMAYRTECYAAALQGCRQGHLLVCWRRTT